MSEGSVFRLFAEEAMRESSNIVGESEKRALEELAVIWAQAALMSDRVFGLSFTSSPHPLDEAISRAPLLMEGCWKRPPTEARSVHWRSIESVKKSGMVPRGIYRTKTPQSGAEYAYVEYGVLSSAGEIPRAIYEERGYAPPFDNLPTKEMYEEWKARNA